MKTEKQKDTYGTNNLSINVLANWAGIFVRILSGFLIPRLIDNKLGQIELGIWDFSWSIVTYFTLVQAGITSSINRYVAMYRSRNDGNGINRYVNSVFIILISMGLIVIILSIISVYLISFFFQVKLTGYIEITQKLVLLLGLGIAIQISMSVFGGVLTGYHRWTLNNGITIFAQLFSLLGMVIVLSLDFGLVGLAVISLSEDFLREILKIIFAYRISPILKIGRKYFNLECAKEMLEFGGKTFINRLGEIIVGQTVNILIISFLGPAKLALYARSNVLVRYVSIFISKYAFVLVPIISSFKRESDNTKLNTFVLNSVRNGIYICLPIMIFLIISGNDLVEVWMGKHYRNEILLSSIVCSYFTYISYQPLYLIFLGLNSHGRPALMNLIASLFAVLFCYLSLSFLNKSLVLVVVSIGIPLTIVNGVYMPYLVHKHLNIPILKFLISVWKDPILNCIPLVISLIIIRFYTTFTVLTKLTMSIIVGFIIIMVTYWICVFPKRWKLKAMSLFYFV